MSRVTIIIGHPDPSPERFCRALSLAYENGAKETGHDVRILDVAALGLPPLTNAAQWRTDPGPDITGAQTAIEWADHLVIVYPLWLGTMPAALKAFFEQVMRPGFALSSGDSGYPKGLLKGRSARIVVTMGMPALAYRLFYRAHSLKSLERNILKFCGIGPVRESLVGMVEGSAASRSRWLAKMHRHGTKAS